MFHNDDDDDEQLLCFQNYVYMIMYIYICIDDRSTFQNQVSTCSASFCGLLFDMSQDVPMWEFPMAGRLLKFAYYVLLRVTTMLMLDGI